jgi:hypothetical protein
MKRRKRDLRGLQEKASAAGFYRSFDRAQETETPASGDRQHDRQALNALVGTTAWSFKP